MNVQIRKPFTCAKQISGIGKVHASTYQQYLHVDFYVRSGGMQTPNNITPKNSKYHAWQAKNNKIQSPNWRLPYTKKI